MERIIKANLGSNSLLTTGLFGLDCFQEILSSLEGNFMAKLKTGDKAPDFNLEDQNGKKVKLADFKGRKLLLYFYPKADTSG